MGKLRERILLASEFPQDVVLGTTVLTVQGDREVCIENYQGIIEYTNNIIRVKTKEKQIRLTGKRLQIEYYTNDEMKITGYIHSIEYCK